MERKKEREKKTKKGFHVFKDFIGKKARSYYFIGMRGRAKGTSRLAKGTTTVFTSHSLVHQAQIYSQQTLFDF